MLARRMPLILGLCVVLLVPALALACPNCKVSVEDTQNQAGGGTGGSMVAGYYYSILFMLGMLFSLVTAMIFFIRREALRTATPVES